MTRAKGVTGPSSLAWKVNSSRISLAAVAPRLMYHSCRASSQKQRSRKRKSPNPKNPPLTPLFLPSSRKQRSLNSKNFPLTPLFPPPNLITPPKKQSFPTSTPFTHHLNYLLSLAPNASRTCHNLENANRPHLLHQCPLQRLGGKALNTTGRRTPLRGSGRAPADRRFGGSLPGSHHHRPSPSCPLLHDLPPHLRWS